MAVGSARICRTRWRGHGEAVGVRHLLLVLERLQYILIDRLAPDDGRHVVHAAVDVVLVHEGLPVTSAVAARAAAVRRTAPTGLVPAS